MDDLSFVAFKVRSCVIDEQDVVRQDEKIHVES